MVPPAAAEAVHTYIRPPMLECSCKAAPSTVGAAALTDRTHLKRGACTSCPVLVLVVYLHYKLLSDVEGGVRDHAQHSSLGEAA